MDLGKIAITPKGDYDNLIIYEKLDLVKKNGSSFISLIDNNSQPLSNNTAWQTVAEKGMDGVPGVDGTNALSFNFKGNVINYAALPSSGNTINDAYYNEADALMYIYNGSSYPTSGNGISFKGANNIPQFADLSFPVTNPSVGEKVQCVDNFIIYQLLDGQISTSSDNPSTSPTIWKSLENRNLRIYEDLPNGTIINAKEQVISDNVQYIALQQAVVGTDIPNKFSKIWIENGFTKSKDLGLKSFEEFKSLEKIKGDSFKGVKIDDNYTGSQVIQRDGTTVTGSGYLTTLNELPAIGTSLNFNSSSKFILFLDDSDNLIEIVDFENQLNEEFIIPAINGATKAKFTTLQVPILHKINREKEKSFKKPDLRLNLLQNRIVKVYDDLNYPNEIPDGTSKIDYDISAINGIVENNPEFNDSRVYKRNSTAISDIRTVDINCNVIGLRFTEKTIYVSFKSRFPSSQNLSRTGFIFQNENGSTRRYNANADLVTDYGAPINGFQDFKFVSENVKDGYVYRDYTLVWNIGNVNVSNKSGVLRIGNYSADNLVNDSQIGDFILSENPIDLNYTYLDLPKMNKSEWIGKNIMFFCDSQGLGSILREIANNLGCNVFKNGNGGRSMKWRESENTPADQAFLYHWSRLEYIKNLHTSGITINAFLYQVSYNDDGGGGEITYPKIQSVEENSPLISDDSTTVTNKLAIFNGLSDQQKENIFGFRQTFVSHIKQLIDLYPDAYFQLCKVMYNPGGGSNAPGSTTEIQRTATKDMRDSLNSQLEEIGGWFGIPVENVSKSTRYYFGNMENHCTDGLHYDQEIGRRLGIGISKSLLKVSF